MQQLASPNCRMTVSVLAAERMLCPGCQAEMRPVEESSDEPIVAEADNPSAMVLVELSSDAPLMRPTVVVPHGPPPKWKARPVAQAWITVAARTGPSHTGVSPSPCCSCLEAWFSGE